ncbi:hypothetical protein Scep_008983 [Stephania cephalantha]|uniref:Uncharacterized protein n=1 Tax=Stephania cephalantha TaxID=152367 RepID=A0AAP0JSF5_9MAGN
MMHLTICNAGIFITNYVKFQAFLSFCEGCEVDIRLFFEKVGKILMGQALLGP